VFQTVVEDVGGPEQAATKDADVLPVGGAVADVVRIPPTGAQAQVAPATESPADAVRVDLVHIVRCIGAVAAEEQSRPAAVDATQGETGNSSLAAGGVWTAAPLSQGSGGSGADGLWRERAFGNGSIFESHGDFAGNNTEDCPRLVTSVDVPMGVYEVFAYYWDTNSSWSLNASLTNAAGELPLFVPNRAGDPNNPSVAADASAFEAPVPLVSTADGRVMWQAPLGTTGFTTKITVYIDDDGTADPINGGNLRTWYDGIGYKLVATPQNPGKKGLVAHYAFEGNTTDSSGTGLDGVVETIGAGNVPAYVFGPAGYGAALDLLPASAGTVGSYVNCGKDPLFDLTDAMTVGAWVNIRSIPDVWRGVICKGDSAWRLATNDTTTGFQFAFTGSGRGWQGANSTTQVGFNEWHYICGTYDVWIGGNSEDKNWKPYRLFDGMIDELRVYDRALSQVEIQTLAAP
jgi:hypothetical protein